MKRIEGEQQDDKFFRNLIVKDQFQTQFKFKVGSGQINNIFKRNSIQLLLSDVDQSQNEEVKEEVKETKKISFLNEDDRKKISFLLNDDDRKKASFLNEEDRKFDDKLIKVITNEFNLDEINNFRVINDCKNNS